MKRIVLITLVIAVLLLQSIGSFAHGGRTDSSGGHKDNKNASGLGSYHYHHGYGPHLHTGGVCPYDEPVVLLAPEPTPSPTPEPRGISVYIEDSAVSFEQDPFIQDGIVMVPLKAIVESLGFETEYNAVTQGILITGNEQIIEIKIGDVNTIVDEESVALDVPPKIVDNTTFVPLRFVAESTGATVEWDGTEYRADIMVD